MVFCFFQEKSYQIPGGQDHGRPGDEPENTIQIHWFNVYRLIEVVFGCEFIAADLLFIHGTPGIKDIGDHKRHQQ